VGSSQPFLIQCIQMQEYGDHKEEEFKATSKDPYKLCQIHCCHAILL